MEGLGKAWGWHAYATVFRYITYLTQIYILPANVTGSAHCLRGKPEAHGFPEKRGALRSQGPWDDMCDAAASDRARLS